MNNTNYKIIIDNNKILALSKFRIPFDLYLLKGERKENILSFRNDLIEAIKTLKSHDNQLLFGRYGSTDTVNVFYDVENILFYNVGTSNFKNLVKNGISFSSLESDETESILSEYGIEYSCIYEYSMIDYDNDVCGKNQLLAKWDSVDFCKFKGSKPVDYWKSIKSIEKEIIRYRGIDCNKNEAFGLDLTVSVPLGIDFNIATSMKPFLDGLICAFHSEEKMEDDLEYLIDKVQCPKSWFSNNSLDLFGARQYLYKYRDYIKWNPADDLCKNVRIVLVPAQEKEWKLGGKIYSL